MVGLDEERRQAPMHTWYFTSRGEGMKDSEETFLNRFSYVVL